MPFHNCLHHTPPCHSSMQCVCHTTPFMLHGVQHTLLPSFAVVSSIPCGRHLQWCTSLQSILPCVHHTTPCMLHCVHRIHGRHFQSCTLCLGEACVIHNVCAPQRHGAVLLVLSTVSARNRDMVQCRLRLWFGLRYSARAPLSVCTFPEHVLKPRSGSTICVQSAWMGLTRTEAGASRRSLWQVPDPPTPLLYKATPQKHVDALLSRPPAAPPWQGGPTSLTGVSVEFHTVPKWLKTVRKWFQCTFFKDRSASMCHAMFQHRCNVGSMFPRNLDAVSQ